MITSSTSAGSTPARSTACCDDVPGQRRAVGLIERAAKRPADRRARGRDDRRLTHELSSFLNTAAKFAAAFAIRRSSGARGPLRAEACLEATP